MADDEYVCTLTEASIQRAKDELHEDPKERLSQVETFRQWILQQPHLKCPTGTNYLLRFLRQAKFSQLRARKEIEGMLALKKEFPEWFDNMDVMKPHVTRFIRTGYVIPLPKPDKDGRKVVVVREGAFTPDRKVFDRDELMKTAMYLFNYMVNDENIMVNGMVFLEDFSHFSVKHEAYWGMEYMKKSMKLMTNLPGRMKAFHIYNAGTVVETMFSIMKPLMPKKLQDRMHMQGSNLETIYKVIPMECLPREYLPDEYTGPCAGTVDEILENLVQEFTSPKNRSRILYESDPQWGNNKAEKPTDIPNESFRKLAVD